MTFKTNTNSENGWFYNIIQAQTLVLGFGITSRSDPYDRLIEYSRPVCAAQQFCNLYYGNFKQIRDLERYVKNQWGEYLSDMFSDDRLEWFDPKHQIELKQLEQFVEQRIVEYPYDTIKKVKKVYTPFTLDDQGFFSKIDTNPDFFLEEVRLTKNAKK